MILFELRSLHFSLPTFNKWIPDFLNVISISLITSAVAKTFAQITSVSPSRSAQDGRSQTRCCWSRLVSTSSKACASRIGSPCEGSGTPAWCRNAACLAISAKGTGEMIKSTRMFDISSIVWTSKMEASIVWTSEMEASSDSRSEGECRSYWIGTFLRQNPNVGTIDFQTCAVKKKVLHFATS